MCSSCGVADVASECCAGLYRIEQPNTNFSLFLIGYSCNLDTRPYRA